jgi:soluble lytic murein transglycosylase-like protein
MNLRHDGHNVRWKKNTGLLLAAALVFPAIARAYCFDEAARKFNVDVTLLRAIAKVESGFRCNAVNVNKDGTRDIGCMQINTSWLPTLKRFGITEADLYNECTNIHVGAWVLAKNIESYGKRWKAVGAYNARSTRKQEDYVNKVWKAWKSAQTMVVKGRS